MSKESIDFTIKFGRILWKSNNRKGNFEGSPQTFGTTLYICCFVRSKLLDWLKYKLSHLMTKPSKWHVRPVKTQISLGIRPVWSESSLCAQWVAKDLSFLHADSEDSDQTGRMPRLIWVFAGRTCQYAGFVTRRLNYRYRDKKNLFHPWRLFHLFWAGPIQ